MEFLYCVQLCIILGKIRQAFLIDSEEIESGHLDIIKSLLSNNALRLINFIRENVVRSREKDLIQQIPNIKSFTAKSDKETQILFYCSEKEWSKKQDFLYDHKLIGKVLGLCGTYVPEIDVPKTGVQINFKSKDGLVDEHIMAYVFLTAEENRKCRDHTNDLILKMNKLMPTIEFVAEIREDLSDSDVLYKLINSTFEELIHDKDFEQIMFQSINSAWNISLVDDDVDVDIVQEKFTPQKQGILISIMVSYLHDLTDNVDLSPKDEKKVETRKKRQSQIYSKILMS